MEINLRRFISEYNYYMDKECSVTRKGEIIGVWIPTDKIQEYETED